LETILIKGKTVILGLTGSIAAYKAADIASKLTQAGVKVEVVMTEPATRFISPLTLRSITGRSVVTSMWEMSSEFSIEHVALAETANAVVIAPATASIIAHLAAGMADDMLACIVLATKAPVIVAPAMNDNMLNNPATRENIKKLKARGFIFIDSGYGRLASGKVGRGRLADIDKILGTIRHVLGRMGNLAGKKIVVTAGGTREAIDPVRYIGNRSSGKMGYALAQAARDRGAEVTLITAAVCPQETAGMQLIEATTAAGMQKAVTAAVKNVDALIMAAAVADYKPKNISGKKIKKVSAALMLELVKTADIVAGIKGNFIRVGFAAESEDLVDNARKKLEEKGLDLIVANYITDKDSGFGTDTNRVTIIDKKSNVEELPLMSKREVAGRILDRIAEFIG
jgi:phosphopantothenoylcysteine decarboxylase/phosphopantothenate--cysteine ligase